MQIKIAIFLSTSLSLVWTTLFIFLFSTISGAQVIPKTVEPQRFDKRFKKKRPPKSTLDLEKPFSNDIPDLQLPSKEYNFVLRKIIVEGATKFRGHKLARVFKKYLGKKIPVSLLNKLAEKITKKYRNAGYILSQAIIPPQKIGSRGVVRIKVIEGYIDKVSYKGKANGTKRLFKSYRKKILASRPLHSDDLERYLLLLNDLPGVKARSVLTPSDSQPGAAQLTIVINHKNVDAYGQIDNRGSKFNGPFQISVGGNVNSTLGMNDRTGIQGVVSTDFEELLFLNVNHDLPVSDEGSRLLFGGTYSNSEPGGSLAPFQIEGTGLTFVVRSSHPVIRTRRENLSLSFGFSLKNSETDILMANVVKDKLRVLDAGANYDFADQYKGINSFRLNISQGINVFGATESGSPKLSRPFGKSNFTKIEGEVLRLQKLSSRWNLLASLIWQYSLSNLLAAEEFVVGGPRYGRGFDPSEISGDHGAAVKLEFQFSDRVANIFLQDYQAYFFGDYGSVWNRSDPTNLTSHVDLFSLGLGIRFNIRSWLSGFLELVKPFDRIVTAEGDKDPRVFFGLTARY